MKHVSLPIYGRLSKKKAYFVEQNTEQISLSRYSRKIRLRAHVSKRWYVSALARRVCKSATASRSSGAWGRPDVARSLTARLLPPATLPERHP